MDYIQIIMNFLNTPTGLTILGGIILFVINKIIDKRPGWAKYEGWMINAVKIAEKWTPNDSNGFLGKADKAMELFIKSYETAKGKPPSKRLLADVSNGMAVVHHDISTKKAA